MAIGKSFKLKKQMMTKESFLGSPRSSVIILNREVQLHVPRKESYLIPHIEIDFTRSIYADLEVAQEKRIYDYWDVDENRTLSDSWTNFTRFSLLNETLLKR